MSDFKPTVCLDFDGVIHSYTSGWVGYTEIVDSPVDGIYEALAAIHDEYRIVICSSRAQTSDGMNSIKDWLSKYNLDQFIDEITAVKPAAFVYVDDRGLTFDGNATTLYNNIKNFHSYLEVDKNV